MKIVVVGQVFPWPTDSGARMRLANVIQALSELGALDLFILERHPVATNQDLPTVMGVDRILRTNLTAQSTLSGSLVRRYPLRLPRKLAGRDQGSVRSTFEEWRRSEYDLAWFSREETYVVLGPLLQGTPKIVDIDDLNEDKVVPQALLSAELRGVSGVGKMLRMLRARRERRLWQALHRRVVRAADLVIVSNHEDAHRFDRRSVRAIPNGYERKGKPVGRLDSNRQPLLVFQGSFVYGPNVDAARWFVSEVFPRIRAVVPNVRLRLVGRAGPDVQRLASPPTVIVTGHVNDMIPELSRATAIVVPLRFGSGTSIKVLEAFAHRVPVVSTRIGARGLGVDDGHQLLLADEPEPFARACIDLMLGRIRVEPMIDAALAHYEQQFTWQQIRPLISDIAKWTIEDSSHKPHR